MLSIEEKMKKWVGFKVNRLELISFSHSQFNHRYFICRCDCGTVKTISLSCIKRGTTKSCGCYTSEETIKTNKSRTGIKWSETDSRKTPGSARLKRIWFGMIKRCEDEKNTAYRYYGARGISVCTEWKERSTFIGWAMSNGYSESLSLDRVNNDGNYEPINCRWATPKEQANNTRRNNYIIYKGEKKSHGEWSQKLGANRSLVAERIRRGWEEERAITTPPIPVKENRVYRKPKLS